MKTLLAVVALVLCLAAPVAAQLDDCNYACVGQLPSVCDLIHSQHECRSDCSNWAGASGFNGCAGGVNPVIVGRGSCSISQGSINPHGKPYWGEMSNDANGLTITASFTCATNSPAYNVSISMGGDAAYGNFGSYGADAHSAAGASESYGCSGSLLQHTVCPPKGQGNCTVTTGGQ